MPFVHHRCATKEELFYSLKRWKTKAFHKSYPLLYLAFHGQKGKILLGKDEVILDELAELLENKCRGVVIYFGSCETLKVDKRRLQSFMEKTETVAVLGYRRNVEWLKSASFDIQLLSWLLEFPYTSVGVKKIQKGLNLDCRSMIRELEFKMEINNRIHFPGTRKKKA